MFLVLILITLLFEIFIINFMNEVRIYVFNYDKDGKRKDVYRNTIKVAIGTPTSFDSICDTFSLLYPGCEIEFIKSL